MFAALYLVLTTAILHYVAVAMIERFRRFKALRNFAKGRHFEAPPLEHPWDVLGILKIYSSTRHLLKETALTNITDLFNRYGDTYASRILTQRVYFTCDPRNIKHVLVNSFEDFDNSTVRVHLFRPITEHGIFAVDGVEWKKARALYSNYFSKTREILDLDVQERGFQDLLVHIPASEPVDLQPLFLRMVLDMTGAFAMGVSIDSLKPNQSPQNRKFAESLMHAKKIMARDGFLGPLHHLLSRRDFYAACSNVHRYVEIVIKQELADKEHQSNGAVGSDHPAARKYLLKKLIQSSTDVTALRDGVVTIMVAGIDSVASLLSTTFWLLARDERVYVKLRESILKTIGLDPPTYDGLRKLTYLRYVFNEAMRVYPPVPFNARTANRDTWLPSGGGKDGQSSVLVKEGERVVFASWGSHRSRKAFGDDAYEFRPERWEGLKSDSLGYVPFNLGPRACVGQQYALFEASYAAVRLIQTFGEIRNRDTRPWTEKIGLNLSNKNGVLVEMVQGSATPE